MARAGLFGAILTLALAQGAQAAQAATVIVTVHGVRNATGEVRVAICREAEFTKPTCPWHGHAPARKGDVTVEIADVPPGVYAAEAFHDENGDRKVNKDFLGRPMEGIGFSNDAKMKFGPPSFEDARFTLGTAKVAIGFSLRYF